MNTLAFMGVSLKNNKEQTELARLMNENNRPIILVEGSAGTGKTFATLVTALQMQSERKYQKIVYIRDAIQVGHDIGHLPGNSDEKMMPY
jgi:PhoH-like ATPase